MHPLMEERQVLAPLWGECICISDVYGRKKSASKRDKRRGYEPAGLVNTLLQRSPYVLPVDRCKNTSSLWPHLGNPGENTEWWPCSRL